MTLDQEASLDARFTGRATQAYLAACLQDWGSLNLQIQADDEMFLRELEEAGGDRDLASWRYLQTGESIARAVGQFVDWRFGGFDNLTSFLDFACGYGRVTRFLATRMPAERIWVSDIYPGAVSFQQQEFGVNGFASVTDPGNLQVDRTFDCILAVSLFSHMPAELFEAWLAKLTEMLAENGMLIFSVHDASLLPPHLALNDSGFSFGEEQKECCAAPSGQKSLFYKAFPG